LEKFNKTFFTYSVVETIFLLGVSVIQFYYLRKSLEGTHGNNLNIWSIATESLIIKSLFKLRYLFFKYF